MLLTLIGLFQEFFQRLLGGFWKRPAVLVEVEYGQDQADDQRDDEPGSQARTKAARSRSARRESG